MLMDKTCEYIFKRGINMGKACNKPVYFNNLCRLHNYPFCKKFKLDSNLDPYTGKLINKSFKDKLEQICVKKNKNAKTPPSITLNDCFEFRIDDKQHPNPKYRNIKFTAREKKRIDDHCTKIEKLDKNLMNKNTKLIVNQVWILNKRLGSGGFGEVFSVTHTEDANIKAAIKIEKTSKKERYFYELEMYKYILREYKQMKMELKIKSLLIPHLYDYGTNFCYKFLVIEKLQPINIVNKNAILKILDALEFLCNLNISHGDIKFENIMKRPSTNEYVLVDFGLSQKIVNIYERSEANTMGTPIFMSIPSHLGYLTYMNDLESLVYCLLDSQNALPWENYKNSIELKNHKTSILKGIWSESPNFMKYFNLTSQHYITKLVKYVATFDLRGKPDFKYLKYSLISN